MAAGNVYNYHTKSDSAVSAYKEALPYFEKIKNDTLRNYRLSQLYYNLGNAYSTSGLNKEAISSFLNSVKYSKQTFKNNEFSQEYIAIANVYASQKQYDNAFRYAEKALEEANSIKDLTAYCYVINDLSSLYLTMYEETKDATYLLKAITNLKKAEKILIKDPSIDKDGIITPSIFHNIGDYYFKASQLDSAVIYFEKSNALGLAINYDYVIGYNNLMLGKIFLEKDNIAQADYYFDKAIPNENQNQYYLEYKIKLYQSLVTLEKEKNNFEKALAYQVKYQENFEKLLNENNNKAINEIEIRYQTNEKELKIKELKLENKQKQQQALTYLFFAVLGTLLAIAIFIVFTSQKKLFKQKEITLEEENRRTALENERNILNNKIALQENEKIEKEKMAQKIIFDLKEEQFKQEINFKERELTANVMQLEKKNEMLLNLKSQLTNLDPSISEKAGFLKSVSRFIEKSLNIEEELDRFTSHFESVHPEFFTKIQEKSAQTLTPLDLKYAAYIKMKLSTKEMANLLNIESKSVRMAQYRIKKKLNLSELDDLKDFINQL